MKKHSTHVTQSVIIYTLCSYGTLLISAEASAIRYIWPRSVLVARVSSDGLIHIVVISCCSAWLGSLLHGSGGIWNIIKNQTVTKSFERCCRFGKNNRIHTNPFWRRRDTPGIDELSLICYPLPRHFSGLTRSSGTESSGQWRTCNTSSRPMDFLGKGMSGLNLSTNTVGRMWSLGLNLVGRSLGTEFNKSVHQLQQQRTGVNDNIHMLTFSWPVLHRVKSTSVSQAQEADPATGHTECTLQDHHRPDSTLGM